VEACCISRNVRESDDQQDANNENNHVRDGSRELRAPQAKASADDRQGGDCQGWLEKLIAATIVAIQSGLVPASAIRTT
jgi:hypothetical protein